MNKEIKGNKEIKDQFKAKIILNKEIKGNLEIKDQFKAKII